MMRHRVRLPIVVVASMIVMTAPAAAQDAKVVKKLEDMNRAAMEDYDLTDFELAKKKLNEALVLIKKNKLEQHPVAAKTHMNLGIVYAGGLGDNDTAMLEFMAALEIDGNVKLDPAYKNKQIQAIFDQAKQTVGGGKIVIEPPAELVTGMQHTPVDEATGSQTIPITVKVGNDVKAKQVILYYRGQGKEDFDPVAMFKQDEYTYQGDIPVDATRGSSLHYYIEAKNEKGKVVATQGTAGSPNIILLTQPVGGGPDIGDGDDEEDPLRKLSGGGNGNGGPTGGGNGATTSVTKAATRGQKVMFLNASVGAGGGFVTGKTEVSAQDVKCCVAPAPFHVMVEIGFYLNPRVTVSAYGRMGFIPGADASLNNAQAASGAPAGFVRMSYALDQNGGGLQLHGDIGAGFIRHRIPLTKNEDSPVQGSVDTSAMGPLFIGGGAKYEKTLAGALQFVFDANLLAGIPVKDKIGTAVLGFGINVDVNLGLAVAF